MITIVDLAKEFALKHHRDQMYGDKPYEYHLNKVYEKVKKFGLGTDAEVVAWLHDVYEDCDISIVDIMDTFGENIATAVKAISNDVSFYNTLRNIRTNKLAKSVKICDRICNMEESVGKPIAEITPVSQEAAAPSWKRPGLRLFVKGARLSSAILEEREREDVL